MCWNLIAQCYEASALLPDRRANLSAEHLPASMLSALLQLYVAVGNHISNACAGYFCGSAGAYPFFRLD
jgi:hypothetical protein